MYVVPRAVIKRMSITGTFVLSLPSAAKLIFYIQQPVFEYVMERTFEQFSERISLQLLTE